MSKRSPLLLAPVLAALCACVSYPPYEDSEPTPSEAPADGASGSKTEWAVRCYNLAQLTTWSVEGEWSDEPTPSGRLRQATGEGPWKVLVLLRAESEPRVHVVNAGALVGEWGRDVLMIDDSGRSEAGSPSWSYVSVADEE